MKADLQSERYAPTGNLSGAGIQKSLGTPSLDRLRVLVREAGQNAWDARASESEPVTFGVHLRTLTTRQHSALEEFLATLPAGSDTRAELGESLRAECRVLEIVDQGTRGLEGPVRADHPPAKGERPDFVNFFRNIGSPRDQALGAGTYGYGKSSLYQLSRCHTIVAYTRTTNNGRSVARTMAASVGSPYTHRDKQYTGRHWWGFRETDAIVDPIEREKAHAVAAALGLDRRSAGENGTSLLVLDPDLAHRSADQAMNAVAESLAWYFWPKMLVREAGEPAMRFHVSCEGVSIAVPTPVDMAPLELFASAMRAAKSSGAGSRIIRCERPIKDLGVLGLAKGMHRARRRLDTGDDEPLIPERSSHIALMRPAELVVKYLERTAIPSDVVEYAGVFICDEGVEPHFAAAEPPAHDDWVPAFLQGHGKRFVNVAIRRVAETADAYALPVEEAGSASAQPSMARVGDLLGGVVLGSDGGRPSPRPGPGARKQKRPPAERLEIGDAEPFRFAMVKGVPCALFQVRVAVPGGRAVAVRARPLLVLEGGSAVPVESEEIRVVGWLDGSSGRVLAASDHIAIPAGQESTIIVAVSLRPDSALSVAVEPLG
jgi:hypothetical protein